MIELTQGYYVYWFCFLVMTLGLYGMLAKRNLVKKVIGLSIFQAAIILFFIIAAYKHGGTVPVLRTFDTAGVSDVAAYVNPLPHTLMLTAIVVGVATLGVAFSLMIRVHEGYGTLDEEKLREKMNR